MSGIKSVQQKRRDAIKGLNPIPSADRYKHSIKDVKSGGYLSFDNQNWLVKSISKYLDVKWSSFKRRNNNYFVTELELFSLKTGEILYMEWEIDDDIEIYVTESEIKLRELTFYGSQVTKSTLESIADDEEGEIKHNGKSYYYIDDDTWAALSFKDEGSQEGIPVRFYEFESNDDKSLTVEMWYDEIGDDRPEREAFLSREVSQSEIEILQLEPNKG